MITDSNALLDFIDHKPQNKQNHVQKVIMEHKKNPLKYKIVKNVKIECIQVLKVLQAVFNVKENIQ